MKKILILLTLPFLPLLTRAQLTTYLSVEAGPQWSLLRVADRGDDFLRSTVRSSFAGVTLGQEITRGLSLVTGIYYQPYRDGINMIDDRPHQARVVSYDAFLIPLRAEYRVQPTEYPVSFTPRIGYVFGLMLPPDFPYQAIGILSSRDGTPYSYTLSQEYSDVNLHMLEVGIGVNLRFAGLWQASLNLSYMTGFTDPMETLVEYIGPGGAGTTATYSTRGNTLYTTLAFNVPVSNLWQNRDYRIRSRIEHSVYDGKSTTRQGQFYVGGELGALWRQLNTSSPAIGPRPMEGRGIFRYSNFHGGIYGGYMLTPELGIDIGANYQRSSTFYAIMYDHEVDFVTREQAPMYLEVPLRFRYFYNAYKEKIYAVVYGGASMLTQFSGGSLEGPGGNFRFTSPDSGSPVDASTNFTATRLASVRPVMRIGAGAEYLLPLNFPLIATLYVNYMHGFLSIEEVTVNNTLPETATTTTLTYNGGGWSIDIGVKYPFKFGGKVPCGKPRERPENQ